MIKRFIYYTSIFFFYSCASLQFDDIILIAQDTFIGIKKIEATDELISSYDESFLILNINKIKSSIMRLQKIVNDEYYWQSDYDEEIVTNRYGKIIRTHGFLYNQEVIENQFQLERSNYSNLVMLKNPDGMLEQFIELELKDSWELNSYYTEIISVPILNQTWVNEYILNKDKFPISTKQKIHPNFPSVEMDFYFKFTVIAD